MFLSTPPQDWFETTLDQFYNGGLGTMHVKDVPLITFPVGKKVLITLDAKLPTMQVVVVDGWDSAAKTMNVSSIITERGDGLAYTAQDHGIGASVQISDPYEMRKDLEEALNTLDTGRVTTNSQDVADGKFADEAARDAYFTSPVDGNSAYIISLGVWTDRVGGAWVQRATGSTPNATDTSSGKVRLADQTQVDAGTDTESGDPLVVIPSTLKVVTDNLATDITTLDNEVDALLAISNARFGNGSDGAQTGALTITGSNNTYILKQYTSFTPGANTVTITPTNCILHIKVQGNVDLTGTTFSFGGKGGPQATDGNGTMGVTNSGLQGSLSITKKKLFAVNYNTGYIQAACGAGGGQGGSGVAAGAGGGCVIFEIGGNLTYSSTTINVNGNGGTAGGGQGAGGGGGGGTFYVLYKGTLTGSPTTNVGGGGGNGGGGGSNGGSGGASIIEDGGAGAGSGTSGSGGNGLYYIQQII